MASGDVAVLGGTVRISTDEKRLFVETIRNFDPAARVWLFGSRVDDAKRGGDIDLAVLSGKIGRMERLKIVQDIVQVIGEQKIDLVVSADGRDAFFRLALEKGVSLDE